jgi:hypothetical protein
VVRVSVKCLRCGRFGHEWIHDPACLNHDPALVTSDTPDETCPNGCERFGDWWVPEDCATHLGGAA